MNVYWSLSVERYAYGVHTDSQTMYHTAQRYVSTDDSSMGHIDGAATSKCTKAT